MEEKRNNNIGWIILLILIIFGLAGYIVYDKFIAEDPKETKVEEKDTSKSETSTLEDEYALAIGKILYDKATAAMKFGEGFNWKNVGMKEDGSCINPDGEGCYTVFTNYDTYMDSIVTQKMKTNFESKNTNIIRKENEVRYSHQTIWSESMNALAIAGYDLEIVSKSANKIKFQIVTKECTNEDYIVSNVCSESDIKKTKKDFLIIKQNENWLVDEMPIILDTL